MTKDQLIRKVLDSAVSGSKKEAEDAIDEYEKQESIEFANWVLQNLAVGRCSDGLKSWYEDYDDNVIEIDKLYYIFKN